MKAKIYKMDPRTGLDISVVSDIERQRLPEHVLLTLEEGCLAMHNSVLYGNSPGHLTGED